MYEPENYRMDEYEAEHGPEHILYEWKGDPKLSAKWPTKEFCTSKGWDRKQTVMAYHWKAIGGPSAEMIVADSWTKAAVGLWPRKRLIGPAAVFRLHLGRKWSQYLGWLTNEDLQRIPPTNISRNGFVEERRLVRVSDLRDGFPVAISETSGDNIG